MKYNLRKVEKVKKSERPDECTLVYIQKVYFGRNHWVKVYDVATIKPMNRDRCSERIRCSLWKQPPYFQYQRLETQNR